MYSPKQTLVSTFVSYLQETYESVFGQGEHHHVDFLGSVAGMVLDTIAQSDALYHDLEHTILVTSVGQEILQAKQLCEGPESVTSRDWLHLMIALLCHDIGYCKGICQQDDCDLGRQTTGLGDEYVFLPFGSTDASLSNYHVDRGKQFVKEQFHDEHLIDLTTVQQIIDLTRFPVRQGSLPDPQGLATLGRSADLIGQFSDRNYLQKLPALFYEFEQNGTNVTLGYRHLIDVRSGLPEFYRKCVHGYIEDAIAYLNHTPAGQKIVTELQANVSSL